MIWTSPVEAVVQVVLALSYSLLGVLKDDGGDVRERVGKSAQHQQQLISLSSVRRKRTPPPSSSATSIK